MGNVNQKGIAPIVWIIIIAILGGVIVVQQVSKKSSNQIGCPQDMRVCPDGTAVQRVPPLCEFAPCPEEPQVKEEVIPEKPTTVSTDLSTFSSQYIGPNPPWPPVIQQSTVSYSCQHIETPELGDTYERNINGKPYCVTSFVEAGAGRRDGDYAYVTVSNGGTKTASFHVGWVNCAGFGGPGDSQYDQCQDDQTTFFNNLDSYIASIM